MPKTTYVYHNARVMDKRLRTVELDLRRMRTGRATIVGSLIIFGLLGLAASQVAPHVSDALAYSISVPHYR